MGAPLGPIQTLPAGLTSLLNLKTLGRVPDELAGFYQPTIEAMELLMNYRCRTNEGVVHGRTLITGENSFRTFSPNTIDVPDSEWWFFHEYGVSAVMTAVAGQSINGLAPMIQYNINGTLDWVVLQVPGPLINSSAAQSVQTACVARNFWARPGSRLGLFLGEITSAAGVSFGARYRATKIPI